MRSRFVLHVKPKCVGLKHEQHFCPTTMFKNLRSEKQISKSGCEQLLTGEVDLPVIWPLKSNYKIQVIS